VALNSKTEMVISLSPGRGTLTNKLVCKSGEDLSTQVIEATP